LKFIGSNKLMGVVRLSDRVRIGAKVIENTADAMSHRQRFRHRRIQKGPNPKEPIAVLRARA